jgi:hypothetical protein
MRTITAASMALLVACAHAHEAEDPSSAHVAASEASPDAEGQSEAPAQEPEQAESAGQPSENATAQKEGRVAGGAEDPSEIPVASSPSGLLKPGAEQKVRDKLGVKAGGGSLRKALQKFQKEHDLPATGILDQRTVELLGLDPDDVFDRASGQ